MELIQLSMKAEYNILCLKHGDLYNHEYVNRLYSMVSRNITLDFKFYCLTEKPYKLHPDIIPIELPSIEVKGWWFKPYMFSNNLGIKGVILYLDLDVVITGDLDKLLTYEPGKLCVPQDFTRAQVPSIKRINSSVCKFNAGKHEFIWKSYLKDYTRIATAYHGDQDYLWKVTQYTAHLFPKEWIQSYKWEIRKSNKLDYDMPIGERRLTTIEDPVIMKECSVAVFHGDPKPHYCEDPIIQQLWR